MDANKQVRGQGTVGAGDASAGAGDAGLSLAEGVRATDAMDASRGVSPLAVWSLSLGCTIGWGCFVMPGTTFLPMAGPGGTLVAFLLGAVAMLTIAINYGYMARRYPGEGGMYVYARRTFGPNSAFVGSWCLVLAYCASMVINATALALVARSVLGTTLQVGFHYVIAGYDVYLGEAVTGIVAILGVGWLCIRGTRLTATVETGLALCMVAGTLGVVGLMLASPRASVEALEPLLNPHVAPLAGIMSVLAMVPWAYIGFESATQVSAESDFAGSRFTGLMIGAVLVGTVMYLAFNTLAAIAVPAGFESWVAYIDSLGAQDGLMSLPTFHAAYLLAGDAGVAVVGVTAFCSVMSGVVGFYVAATRLIHAMAVDGALPERFARLHPSYRTPVKATTTVMLATFLAPFAGRNILNWVLDLMSLGALIAYVYTSAAVIRHARREGQRGMVAVGVLGMLVSCVCIVLLVVPIPGLETSLQKESYVILLAWIALGVNFYTPSSMR